jgi:hypothetical protein
MAEVIRIRPVMLQEAWSNIETALEEAMERYDFSIPHGVKAEVRATFSASKLVGKGILNQQDVKLFHDIRAFKNGNAQWTRNTNVIDSARLLAECIRES